MLLVSLETTTGQETCDGIVAMGKMLFLLRNDPMPSSGPVLNPNCDVMTTCIRTNNMSPPKTYKEALMASRPPTQ